MDISVYHGTIKRCRCEELLAENGKNGAFLIRDSETIQGVLCLCVYDKGVVHTYRILQSHAGYFALQTSQGVKEIFFKTLIDLVDNYRKADQGLITHLRYPVKRKKCALFNSTYSPAPFPTPNPTPTPSPASTTYPACDPDESCYQNIQDIHEYVEVLP